MNTVTVSQNDDLQYILDNCVEDTTIYLKSGLYRAKIKIRKNGLHIVGESRETTVISWDDYATKLHADGREYNTFRTYTVCVTGEGVTMENLTIENTNEHPETVGQCVALSVNAKRFYAKNVDLRSTQDTLFTSPFPDDLVIRYSGLTDDPTYYDGFIPKDELILEGNAVHLFDSCHIYGTVDFIFGCAEAYFKDCELISIKDARNEGFVTAPAHSLKQTHGYAFVNCKFLNGGCEEKSIYLARPWRDFGRCDFIDCYVDGHIFPTLFDKWNDTYRDKTCRMNYYNLTSKNAITPVLWANELTKAQADVIKRRLNKIRNEK